METCLVAKTHVISMPTKEKLAEMRAKLNGASQHVLQASLHAGVTLKNATVTTHHGFAGFRRSMLMAICGYSLVQSSVYFVGVYRTVYLCRSCETRCRRSFMALQNYIEIKNSL